MSNCTYCGVNGVGLFLGESVDALTRRKESSFGNNQVAFLDLDKEIGRETRIITESIKGFRVGVYQGTVENDILLEAKTLGAHGVLLEVSEALTKEDLGKIAGQIISGLKRAMGSPCTIL